MLLFVAILRRKLIQDETYVLCLNVDRLQLRSKEVVGPSSIDQLTMAAMAIRTKGKPERAVRSRLQLPALARSSVSPISDSPS